MEQAQQATSQRAAKRSRKEPRSTLLLLGSEEVFPDDVLHRIFCGWQFRVVGRSQTLLDGLSRLESKDIDLVLLSCEFCDEELSLFAFDAHRRGFFGPILQVASPFHREAAKGPLMNNEELPRARLDQAGWKAELNDTSKEQLAPLNRAHTKPLAGGARYGPRFIGAPGSIVLTQRQQIVMTRVSEGRSNQEIAYELNCSEGSVKAVLQQLFTKFGVRKRTQIVRLAIESFLIEPEIIRPFTK